jgi:hypothetical protein
MSWEAVTAVAAVVALLITIARQLSALNRAQIEKAKHEAEEKSKMETRVVTLEREFSGMSTRLADHIKHTGAAIDALRQEMPNAIMNGVSRAIASTLEMQERVHRQFLDELHAQNVAANAPLPVSKPRTKRATKA